MKNECSCHIASVCEGECYDPSRIVFCALHGAAPDLLDSVNRLLELIDAYLPYDQRDGQTTIAVAMQIKIARKAIAKASK